MTMPRRSFVHAALLAPLTVRAVPEPLVVGMIGPLSTPTGTQLLEGVSAALREANDTGARPLRLVPLDDGGDPARAAANVRELLQQRAVCFTGMLDTPAADAVAPVLATARVPMLGVASGVEALRDPAYRCLFHTRATRRDDAATIVAQLDSLGITRIAVLHSTDAFGQEGQTGAFTELARLAIRAVAVVAVPPDARASAEAVAAFRKEQAEAVIALAPAACTASVVRELAAQGAWPRVITVSEIGVDRLVGELGKTSRGLGVSQVLPHPGRTTTPLVREFHGALRRNGAVSAPGYAGLEGYIQGRLVVEALRRGAGRAALVSVLDNASFDFNGYRLRYTPGNRRGSSFVELAVVGPDGRLHV